MTPRVGLRSKSDRAACDRCGGHGVDSCVHDVSPGMWSGKSVQAQSRVTTTAITTPPALDRVQPRPRRASRGRIRPTGRHPSVSSFADRWLGRYTKRVIRIDVNPRASVRCPLALRPVCLQRCLPSADRECCVPPKMSAPQSLRSERHGEKET
jgi:hypothetical protein